MSNAGSHWSVNLWDRAQVQTTLLRRVLERMGISLDTFRVVYEDERRKSFGERGARRKKAES